MPDDPRARRALSFTVDALTAAVDEVHDSPPGRAFTTPSLPLVRYLNTFLLEGPHPGVTVTDLSALATRHLPDAATHCSAWVADTRTASRLEPALIADGWELERDALLALASGAQPPEPAPGRVREAAPEELGALYAEWTREDQPEGTDAEHAQFAGYIERDLRALPERRFVVDGADGPAAMTRLRLAGGVAQIEDVFTAAGERRRGHAAALVAHCARVALADGADLVFVPGAADPDRDGWSAEHLYRSLGFTDELVRTIDATRPRPDRDGA